MTTIKKACKGALYPKSSSVSRKLKSGGDLGMKSVKAGYDKNPGVTRADIIVAAKGQAKKGMKVKKAQAGDNLPKVEKPMKKTNPSSNVSKVKVTMKKGGKMTKKCAYGCK